MAEPIPQHPNPEALLPKTVIIGETPIYLSAAHRIGNEDISAITILGAGKRANEGVGSAVPLVNEVSRKKGEEGLMVDKPLTNLNDFDEVAWDKISGLQWTDESGVAHTIPKDQLSLTPAEEVQTEAGLTPAPEATPEVSPEPKLTLPEKPAVLPAKEARGVLETITEDPNTITIVGLKAYETRALDLADRSMQKMATPRAQERVDAQRNLWEKTKDAAHGLHEIVFTTIWKQSVGGIYFHEKSRQYYLSMLKAAETPFAEDAIRLAEARAKATYDKKLADSNFIVRIGTKAVDWLKDKVGVRTTIQKLALEEMGAMKRDGEIKGAETFDREAKAVRARFGQDFDSADQFVRKQLGEKLEILDPENAEHKPLVEGIQSLLKQYANGEIATKEEFNERTKEFFNATLKNVRPDIFAEAELYSSSLLDVAETLRTKMSHEGGLANIDEAINSMQIRLGLGQMGEVTSLEPTSVEKGIGQVRDIAEWLNKKHVLVPMVFNEATIGSAVAIALSATKFFSTMPARAIAGLGGGALAGGLFAGWREYGQLNRDYLTHLREKETGAVFTETQKKRAWFEKFAIKQRSASEMITTMQSSLYEASPIEGQPPVLKSALTDDELRTVFATVADTQARKAVSETGPKRIGLIQYSNRETIESERAALDITANKALVDVDAYLSTHAEQATAVLGENTFPDFMVKLTTSQTQVLKEGVGVLANQEDPVFATLNLVNQYAPEADIVKRRWPFASNMLTGDEKALGLDAIMDEFHKEARVEAVKYGAKAGAVSAGLGAVIHALGDIGHISATTQTTEHTAKIPLSIPTADHALPLHDGPYIFPKELSIVQHMENGKTFYDAKIDLPLLDNLKGQQDFEIGNHLNEHQLKTTLEKFGMTVAEPHRTGEIIATAHETIPVPHLNGPGNEAIKISLPEGYDIKYIDSAHNWQIHDAQDKLVTSVKFTENGDIAGTPSEIAQLKSTMEANGYRITSPVTDHYQPHVETPTNIPTIVEAGPGTNPSMMEIPATSLKEGGMWDYFLNKSQGDNPTSSANGLKNLFRVYTYEQHNANIQVPEGAHTGYIQEHLRPATFGTLADGSPNHVQELNLARIPQDATIKLPESVFGNEGIDWFTTRNDEAIAHMNQLVEAGHILDTSGDHVIRGPMDAINYMYQSKDADAHIDAIVLKLGYVGQDDKMPSSADIHTLMQHMSSADTTAAPAEAVTKVTEVAVSAKDVPPIDIHTPTLNLMYAEDQPGQIFANEVQIPISETFTTLTREATVNDAPWIPIFIPYRHVLEAATGEVIDTKPKAQESLLSPFGNESAYLSRETMDQRKSPRLVENPEAKLNQHEEITWYLSTLPPEDVATLEGLLNQEYPPVNPNTRAIVTIPVSQAGSNIYSRLTSFVGQTNADGTPFDAKKAEFIVFDAHVASPDGSVSGTLPGDTKTEVDRFLADHPDMRVLYMTHSYTEPPTSGRVKRDVSNFALSRIATLPVDSADVAVISESGAGGDISPTYLSSIIESFDAQPTLDMVSGAYELPHEAFAQYPLLFAQHRAFELMDSLVRHGDAGSIPGVYSGNIGTRASTLAAVGNYNPSAMVAEDRELSWLVRQARGSSDVMTTLPDMKATIDPKETVYIHLQQLGLADKAVSLDQNEVYKDMPWTDMATKATESYSQNQLESHLSNMYANMYPTLKATNPERFDAYFGRTMNSLGIQYELTDGAVKILDMKELPINMNAMIDIESFAKTAAVEVVAATPNAPENSREELTSLAGEQPQEPISDAPVSESVTTGIASAETIDTTPSGLPIEETPIITPVSPEPTVEQQSIPQQETTTQPPAETPKAEQQSVPQQEVASPPTETLSSVTPTPETPAQSAYEAAPQGVEDRINKALINASESAASVELSPGELMDYIKSTVDIAGTRITEGKIVIDGNTVKLSDMKADVHLGKARLGDAEFSTTLITDPAKGLSVDKQSLKMKLPFLMRPWSKMIHTTLDDFNGLVLTHLNGRIDQKWQADRLDIVGDKLEVRFAKKST